METPLEDGVETTTPNPCDANLDSSLCGYEAGCHPLEGGGYICLCSHDVLPPNDDEERSCTREEGFGNPPLPSEIPSPTNSTDEANVNDNIYQNKSSTKIEVLISQEIEPATNRSTAQKVHPTDAVFGKGKMEKIFGKTDTNSTLQQQNSTFVMNSHSGNIASDSSTILSHSLPIPLLLLTIVASAVVVFVLVLSTACLVGRYRRKRRLRASCRHGRGSVETGSVCCPPFGDKNVSPPPSPFGPFGPFASTALGSDLSKCLRQYVTNPNYYSSSPDGPAWLRLVRDMEIPAESLTFAQEVGEGFFGKVHKAEYKTPDGTSVNVAVKILKDGASPEAQSDFEREVEIMSSFNHENILQLMGVVIQDPSTTPWMVFEFMELGDLAELLRKNNSWLGKPPTLANEEERQRYYRLEMGDLIWVATQIASGMVYLSAQHFVHRDLACRNCLVGTNLMVKISDFGMSRDIYTCDYYKIGGSRLLPVRWMAPESIMYGKFTLESDVWSYGVVLWEIFTYGKQPYYGHSNEDVIKLILQGVLLSPPEECPPFICTIMAGCWRTESRERLKFPDVFNLLVANCPYRQIAGSSCGDMYQEELDADDYLLPNSSRAINLGKIG